MSSDRSDPFAKIAAEMRAQTMVELSAALRAAEDPILKKLAVDLVPPLFRNDYRGEAASAGARWAHAYARPRIAALPTFLVRVHSGPFSSDDVANLRMTLEGAGLKQTALAIIDDQPIPPSIRAEVAPIVPWLLDTEALANLMMNAGVGVTTRVYETKLLSPLYFRG